MELVITYVSLYFNLRSDGQQKFYEFVIKS